jgi:glycosyltransferase involved in cell wall biosynthesis
VVEPRHGAFPEIIARSGGGLLVPPEDPAALAQALHTLVTDRPRAAALGQAAAAGVRQHYTIAQAATLAEQAYQGVIR